MSVFSLCSGKGSNKYKSSRDEEINSQFHGAPESQQCEGAYKYATKAEDVQVFQLTKDVKGDLPDLNSPTYFECECEHHAMYSATSTKTDGQFASVKSLWSACSGERSDTESARGRPQGAPYQEDVEGILRELKNLSKNQAEMKQKMTNLATEQTVQKLDAKLDSLSDRTNNTTPQTAHVTHQNFVFHININSGEPQEENYPRFVLRDDVKDNVKACVNSELQPEHNLEVKEVRQGSIVIVLDTSRLDQPGLAKFFTALATGSLSQALLRGVKAGVADEQLQLTLDGCWPEHQATHPSTPTSGQPSKQTAPTQTPGLRTVVSRSNIVISPASSTSNCSESTSSSRSSRHALRASDSEVSVKSTGTLSLTRKPSSSGFSWLREKLRRSSHKHERTSHKKRYLANQTATRLEGAAAEDYNSTVSSQATDEGYDTVNMPLSVIPKKRSTRDAATDTSVDTCEKNVATDTVSCMKKRCY